MSGKPTGNPAAGGPDIGAGLPGTAARNPGPSTDTMTGIVDDDGREVKAAELLARENAQNRRTTLVPAITNETNDTELHDIINLLRTKISDFEAASVYPITVSPAIRSTIKLNPPLKFDGTRKEDL
ncbi:hypothetical protein QBC32DRAFT_224365 [Pseudoneurospora amorphoporcata]|uniref:Uncharacterized protein n=1 Tax=Pseudoneurospora amorphoporcata TaxID=241081 RepID=A0AAN6SBR4_9PEZI|nr:hypothetical protein QBC32DRAFT_224365 [Pseudoneurospora amorphoporcata]